MYAIIRNEKGKYYTSTVFGYFCKVTAKDNYDKYLESIYKRYYLVLNYEKTKLIKKYIFEKNNKYLNPQILIVDSEQENWIINEDGQGCISFLIEFEQDKIENITNEYCWFKSQRLKYHIILN